MKDATVNALLRNPLMPVETWTVEPSATRDVVLVLDHFRPERHAVTQLYNKHFLGVVYIVDATGWPGCLKIRPAQACKHIIQPVSCRARIAKFHFIHGKKWCDFDPSGTTKACRGDVRAVR